LAAAGFFWTALVAHATADARTLGATSETTLYDLPAGSDAWGTPSFDSSGVLYGTTSGGGVGFGTAYALRPPRAGRTNWRPAVLSNLTGADGAEPIAGLTAGPNGVLYGTASAGGSARNGSYGTVFELRPPGPGQYYWTQSVLHDFTGIDGDGVQPYAGPLVAGPGGALYGTTITTGVSFCGMAFSVSPPERKRGRRWTETVLVDLNGQAGCQPFAGLTPDGSGGFYGAGVGGGLACGCGAVFHLTPPPSSGGPWTTTAVYSFLGTSAGDGSGPYGTLTLAHNGVLYGTTQAGGVANLGTVFSLAPPSVGSTQWTERVLHSFTGPPDGQYPWSPVTLGPGGTVYGTTAAGDAGNGGIFKLSPPRRGSAAWHEAILHAFNGTDGREPFAGLTFGPDGALYGVTYGGGAFDGGAVFRVVP
jgi:uncharacterized repeat protein (TIGR03803 family)